MIQDYRITCDRCKVQIPNDRGIWFAIGTPAPSDWYSPGPDSWARVDICPECVAKATMSDEDRLALLVRLSQEAASVARRLSESMPLRVNDIERNELACIDGSANMIGNMASRLARKIEKEQACSR